MSELGGTSYDLVGEGPCVVLIHGLGLSRRMWDDYLSAFGGYQVLRYDLWGHGRSAPAPQEGSLTLYADQLANLMDGLGIARAHIVGFSIGGMINRRFVMDHPNKVASLVILNAPHDRGEDAQAQVEQRALSVRDQGAFATFDAALRRWFTPEHLETGKGPTCARTWRAQVDANSYAAAAWVLAHGVRELVAPDPPIGHPTLVMTCENDSGSTPAMSHAIASEIAASELCILPRLQHLGVMEQPDVFTDPILKFLERQTP